MGNNSPGLIKQRTGDEGPPVCGKERGGGRDLGGPSYQ